MPSMHKTVSVRGLYFPKNFSANDANDFGMRALSEKDTCTVFTPNAEIAQMCAEDASLMALLNSADLLLPDGAGVILASKILGAPLKEKIAGIAWAEGLFHSIQSGEGEKARIFLLGGKPAVAEAAKEKLLEKYPKLQIVGTHDGYFEKTGEQNDAVIERINESGAELLLVCLGAPMQENWISANKERLPNVRLMAGLGGSLDVWAGNVKRAPRIFIKLNLEWLYRLLKEPRRIGRMMKLPKYILGTYKEKMQKKKPSRPEVNPKV